MSRILRTSATRSITCARTSSRVTNHVQRVHPHVCISESMGGSITRVCVVFATTFADSRTRVYSCGDVVGPDQGHRDPKEPRSLAHSNTVHIRREIIEQEHVMHAHVFKAGNHGHCVNSPVQSSSYSQDNCFSTIVVHIPCTTL